MADQLLSGVHFPPCYHIAALSLFDRVCRFTDPDHFAFEFIHLHLRGTHEAILDEIIKQD